MCIAVTMLCIFRSIKLPSGLVLNYPGVNCDKISDFFPSQLYSVDDPLLKPSFMKFILDSIFQDGVDPSENMLYKPIIATDEILSRFPKVSCLIASADPLRDSNLEFMMHVKRSGVETKIYMFEDFIHGFNNMENKQGVEEFKKGT